MTIYDRSMFGTRPATFTSERAAADWRLWLEEFGPGVREVLVLRDGAAIAEWVVVPRDFHLEATDWLTDSGRFGHVPL